MAPEYNIWDHVIKQHNTRKWTGLSQIPSYVILPALQAWHLKLSAYQLVYYAVQISCWVIRLQFNHALDTGMIKDTGQL